MPDAPGEVSEDKINCAWEVKMKRYASVASCELKNGYKRDDYVAV